MSLYKKISKFGFALIALGGACYVYAAYFFPGSGGYGGAGMAGLPAVFLMLASFVMIGLGAVMAIISLTIFFIKSRRGSKK